MKKRFILLIILSSIFFVPIALAQESKLSLSPGALEFMVDPGQVVMGQSILVNQTNQDLRFKLEPMDFKIVDEKGNLEFFYKEENSASSWVVPQYIEITVKANESREINFVINAPENAAQGDHYAALVLKPINNGLNLTNDLAILTLITINGEDVKKQGKLIDFNGPLFHQSGLIDFKIRFKNSGNMHFSPEMRLSMFDSDNNLISSASLKKQVVFADTIRQYEGKWQPPQTTFGLYKAKLTIISAKTEADNLEKEIWIIVFPWKTFSYILLLILIFFFGRYFGRIKKMNQKYFNKKKNN